MPTAEHHENAMSGSDHGSITPGTPIFRWPVVTGVGWPLTALSFYLVLRIEQFEKVGQPTGLGIYYHVVIIFGLLLFVNNQLRKGAHRRLSLSACELLCVYSMMNIGACFGCWESLGTLIPSLAYPAYAAASSSNNSWLKPVIASLPPWAVVKDPVAATALFQGGDWSAVWPAWLAPFLGWGALLSTLFVMFVALSRLLWETWAHHEKLSFPLTALPLDMTEPGAALWRAPLFWTGAAVALVLDVVNGLHQVVPAIPELYQKFNVFDIGPAGPAWSAIGQVPITIHPLMLGIGFLLRTDLLFSTWFFYLLGKLQLYVAGMYGVAHGSAYAILGNSPGLLAQNFGAMTVLVIGVLINSRRMFARHIAMIRAGDRRPLVNYAVIAFGMGILLVAFNQLGLSIGLALIAVVVVLILAVFVTRLRAELGLPVHNMQFMGPDGPITAAFNGHLSSSDQGALSDLFALNRSLQGHPMPHVMEGAYMQDKAGSVSRPFWLIICGTGVLCAMLAPWLFLAMASPRGLELTTGGYQNLGGEGWNQMLRYVMSPHVPDTTALGEMSVGAVVTLFLLILSRYWIGSPFHPVGYAICGSWGTSMVWTPFLAAWIAKCLVLKYGGATMYRKGVSLALGIVAGEFVAGALWNVFSLVFHVQGYRIWLF